jgi:hypothetical protein
MMTLARTLVRSATLLLVLSSFAVLAVGSRPAVAEVVAAPASWPALETPPGARVVSVADDLVMNGCPCRVARFEIAGRVEEVLQFYRTRFSATHPFESRFEAQHVIATRRADHFHTVQLQSVGEQVHATTITTWLHPARMQSAAERDTEALLPAGTVVVSTLQSNDAGRHALTVIGINRHGMTANREHLLAALRARGFERVSADATDTSALRMTAPGEDVVLAIGDAGPYRTVLVQRTRETVR